MITANPFKKRKKRDPFHQLHAAILTESETQPERPKKKRATSPASIQRRHLDYLARQADREARGIVDRRKHIPEDPDTPPDVLNNVQGSSAGAGSGEFHVYKQSRRRELERTTALEHAHQQDKDSTDWLQSVQQKKLADDEKTAKNRAKRLKAKQRQLKAKNENCKDEDVQGNQGSESQIG